MFPFAKNALTLFGALVLTGVVATVPAHGQDTEPSSAPNEQTPAPEEQNPPPRRSRFRIGPQVGVYLPTDSRTRDRFGDSWVSFGIGIGPIRPAEIGGRVGVDLNILYKSRGDNRALLIPFGLSYRRALSEGAASPYAGASVNAVFANVRSVPDNVPSGFRTGFGGSVFLGTTLRENAFVEARYLAVSRIRSFDLSGLNLTAGYRF